MRLEFRGMLSAQSAWLVIAFGSLSSARFPGPTLLADNPQFHPLRNLAERSLQCVGNLPESAHRRINDSALDPADVCPVEAAIGAEAFLRVSSLFAEFAHHDADGFCLQISRLDLPLAPLHPMVVAL
ncbi:MAG: hypothetical protein JWO80_3066 [Bryobacterales bacterium]|nr:hypothetical protein [Bryobacterales bacterium]